MKQFRLKSLLRLLPAALIAFLPLGFMDGKILELYYQLRGPRPASPKIAVVSLPSSSTWVRRLPESFEGRFRNCVDLSEETLLLSPCKKFELRSKYSVSSISDLQIELTDALGLKVKKVLSPEDILYFGKLGSFTQLNYRDLSQGSENIPQDTIIVLVSSNPPTGPPLTTPLGAMNQSEVFLNLLANLVEGKSLGRGNLYQQAILCLAIIFITSYFVYFLPTAITLIYLGGLFGFLILSAFVLFETTNIQLLIAAPFLAAVVTYLLGISDRLDRRDRSEWSIEREKENLYRLDEMRNNFLSLISHDLKTPIAKIQSIVERLIHTDSRLGAQERQLEFQKILAANKELFKNISSLLLLSRIEAQEFQLKREPTDLKALLETVVKDFEELANEKKIQIKTELEPQFLVDMDQALVREVAANLIGNAIKYSSENGQILLRCGDSENDQALMPPQSSVWFEVQDYGPGIPKEEQDRVFEKFFRGSNEYVPADQPVQGSGLGLYLSAFFVERHNGKISLYSRTSKDPISEEISALGYFKGDETGTVMRVALPQESLYDGRA